MSYLAFKRLTALILVLGLTLAVTPAWGGEFRNDPNQGASSGYIPPGSRYDEDREDTGNDGDPDGPSVDMPVPPNAGSQVVGRVDPAGPAGSPGVWSVWQQWITGILQLYGVR
jgi:hypothetical protein